MGTAAVLMEQVVSCAAGGGPWPAFTRDLQSLDPQTSAAARCMALEMLASSKAKPVAIVVNHNPPRISNGSATAVTWPTIFSSASSLDLRFTVDSFHPRQM